MWWQTVWGDLTVSSLKGRRQVEYEDKKQGGSNWERVREGEGGRMLPLPAENGCCNLEPILIHQNDIKVESKKRRTWEQPEGPTDNGSEGKESSVSREGGLKKETGGHKLEATGNTKSWRASKSSHFYLPKHRIEHRDMLRKYTTGDLLLCHDWRSAIGSTTILHIQLCCW